MACRAEDIQTAQGIIDRYNALPNWTVSCPRYIEIHTGWSAAKAMRVYVAARAARKGR